MVYWSLILIRFKKQPDHRRLLRTTRRILRFRIRQAVEQRIQLAPVTAAVKPQHRVNPVDRIRKTIYNFSRIIRYSAEEK